MRIASIVIFFLVAGLAARTTHASDIQMLPPTPFNSSTPCDMTGTHSQLLVFNPGVTSGGGINCNTLFTANPVNGDVSITGNTTITGTLGITGDTTVIGNTTLNGATTVSNGNFIVNDNAFIRGFAAIGRRLFTGFDGAGFFWLGPPDLIDSPPYSHAFGYHLNGDAVDYVFLGSNGSTVVIDNQLKIGVSGTLTRISADTLLNLQNNGKCPHGNMALFQDASNNFSCVDVTDIVNGAGAQMGVAVMPSCPAGTSLTSTDGLTFTCTSPPAAPAITASCPSGQVLNGVIGGSPVCVTQAITASCPSGQALNGIVNGSPVCAASSASSSCPTDGAAYTQVQTGSTVTCLPVCPAGNLGPAVGTMQSISPPNTSVPNGYITQRTGEFTETDACDPYAGSFIVTWHGECVDQSGYGGWAVIIDSNNEGCGP